MTDSKLKSISESFGNIAVGFPISYGANLAILPFYAADFGSGESHRVALAGLWVGLWFTIIAVVRSYLFRRLFEKFGEKENAYTLLKRGIRSLWK
jgi:hypothetical protein